MCPYFVIFQQIAFCNAIFVKSNIVIEILCVEYETCNYCMIVVLFDELGCVSGKKHKWL